MVSKKSPVQIRQRASLHEPTKKIKKFDKKPTFMVLFFEKHEASPSGKAAGFDPAIQRFESFRLRKTEA